MWAGVIYLIMPYLLESAPSNFLSGSSKKGHLAKVSMFVFVFVFVFSPQMQHRLISFGYA